MRRSYVIGFIAIFTLLLVSHLRNYINNLTVKFIKCEPQKANKLERTLLFVNNLEKAEKKVFSQYNEDGVLEAIFKKIGAKDKKYVEFGVENGVQCNSRFFREKYGWTGLMMDGGFNRPEIGLRKEMLFPHNVVSLFKKYNVSKRFDLLSEDTDLKDFWLLVSIFEAGYRPRVVIGEINAALGPIDSITVPLEMNLSMWDRTQYFGYSVMAGWHLARYYGYSMVYCESHGVNCIWVIDGEEGFGKGIRLSDFLKGGGLWRPETYVRHKKDLKKRQFTNINGSSNLTAMINSKYRHPG